MAGIDSGTGTAGSSFTHYNYPGIYQNQDFHHCGLEPGDDIVNYDNAQEVQTCELVNLAEYVLSAWSVDMIRELIVYLVLPQRPNMFAVVWPSMATISSLLVLMD